METVVATVPRAAATMVRPLALLPLALSAVALSGCGTTYEDCRDQARKQWQKCAVEALSRDSARQVAVVACLRTHEREAEACKRWPKEVEQAAHRPDGRRGDDG